MPGSLSKTDEERAARDGFNVRPALMAEAEELAPKIFRPRLFQVIVRGLTYFHEAHPEDPQAGVLSFAVRPQAKQSGVGRAIFNALAREFKA